MNRYKTYRDFLKWGPKSKSLHHDFVLKLMVTTGDPHVCQSHVIPIIFLVWIPSVSAAGQRYAGWKLPSSSSPQLSVFVHVFQHDISNFSEPHPSTHTHTQKKKVVIALVSHFIRYRTYIATSFQPVMATQISPTAWSHCWTLTQALMPALQEILGHRLSGTLAKVKLEHKATCELQ